MLPFTFNKIQNSSLEKEMNSFSLKIDDSPYEYNGIKVPRVTHILSKMLHEESLMGWANFVGRIKHMDHTVIAEEAAHIGTVVHSRIECFFKGIEVELPDDYKIKNAYDSFLLWWDKITSHNAVSVLLIEASMACRYYGGTLDCLLLINDKIYIVDFKTSNHFNYKYHLQTAAYRRLLYYNRGIIPDGVVILKLSKENVSFEEQIIDLTTYDGVVYMNQCDQLFMSLVYAYYNRHMLENRYDEMY